jgi:hypothetical protein
MTTPLDSGTLLISGEEACVLEKGQEHQNTTNAKHNKAALALCQANLQYLKTEAQKYPEILCLAKNLS